MDDLTVSGDGVKIYAEPVATIILLLKVAAAIVGLIRAFKRDEVDLNITKPLEEIIRGIDGIMKQVDALREFIPVALDDAFRKRITISVATAMDKFNHALAGLTDDQIRRLSKNSDEYKAVQKIADEQLTNAYDLRGYDFPGYFAVCTASLSYIAMCVVLRSPKEQVVEFKNKINKWLAQTIDPQNETSASVVRNKMIAGANQARAIVESYPQDVWLGFYTINGIVVDLTEGSVMAVRDPGDKPDRPERAVKYVNWYAHQAGNFDVGLQWNADRQIGDEPNPRGPSWRLIPSEGNPDLHDRDESARARCQNNLDDGRGGGLNIYVRKGRDLYARAKELDVTIAGIKEMMVKLEKAAREFN
jgi:hypothetical protein